MARQYKDDPGVVGWQIDNELGKPFCYDPLCQTTFQGWCREKYITLEAVNEAWGMIFWGHTYTTWSEIPLPWNAFGEAHNPSLALDCHRFHSTSTRDFLRRQVDILRRIAPRQAITQNAMGMYGRIDYSELFAPLDFLTFTNYTLPGPFAG